MVTFVESGIIIIIALIFSSYMRAISEIKTEKYEKGSYKARIQMDLLTTKIAQKSSLTDFAKFLFGIKSEKYAKGSNEEKLYQALIRIKRARGEEVYIERDSAAIIFTRIISWCLVFWALYIIQSCADCFPPVP